MEIFFGRAQLPAIIAFIVCGFLSGVCYDSLKIKRRIFGCPFIVLCADDLIFAFVCTLLVVMCSFSFNDGNLKWYEFPCMCLGFYLYRKTISKLVIGISFYIIKKLKRLFIFVFMPIKYLFYKIQKAISCVCKKFYLYVVFQIKRKEYTLIKMIVK